MSIVFSVNYLKDLEQLILDEKIKIDMIKYPSIGIDDKALKRALLLKPINYHGFAPCEYYLGNKSFIESFNVNKIREIFKQIKPKFISAHLEGLKHQYLYQKNNLEKIVYEQTIQNINLIKSSFNLPFLLENTVPHNKIERIEYLTKPSVITQIVKETNTSFLLDTAHARLAANYLGMEFRQYLNQLPLDCLYEVHLNGTIYAEGQMKAPHTKLNEEDYQLLKYLLKNTPTKVVTLEYGPLSLVKDYHTTNPIVREQLIEQITKIRDIIT